MIRGSLAEIRKGDHPWQKIFFEICGIFDEQRLHFVLLYLYRSFVTYEAAAFFAASMFT